MDIAAQSTVASTQNPVTPAVGNSSTNKAAAQAVSGNGKSTKSFTDVLDQTLMNGTPIQPGEGSMGLDALLQALTPVLIMTLLTQGQAGKPGTGEVGAAGAKEPDSIIVKALQTLGEQSDALNQLIGSGAFQQWLSQISQLLSSMNPGDSTTADTNAANTSLQSSNEKVLPKNVVQAQAIMNQFMSALSQNKDSLLFQQLVESFQEVVSPVLSAQLAPKTVTNPTKGLSNSPISETSSLSKGSAANLQAMVNVILDSSSKADASASKEAAYNSDFKLKLIQENTHFAKLDALSAKSGMADRMMLAALQSGIGSEVETNTDVLPTNSSLSSQDLTRMMQTEQVKLVKPMMLAALQSGIGSDAETNTEVLPTNSSLSFQDLTRMLQTQQMKPVQPITAQSFVQDMSQFVMKNFKVNASNGFSEARLSLSPENLGQVDVKLTMHNGQLVAHFAAQTLLGKEMLEGQLSQLKLSLQGQGLQVERLEVTQNSNLQSSFFQDQKQQQFSQQFARQNKSGYNDTDSKTESFSAEMANMVNLRSAYGNAFDVTA